MCSGPSDNRIKIEFCASIEAPESPEFISIGFFHGNENIANVLMDEKMQKSILETPLSAKHRFYLEK